MSIRASYPSVTRDFHLLFIVIAIMIIAVSIYMAYDNFDNYSESRMSDITYDASRIDRAMAREIDNASYILESLARQISHIGAEDLSGISALLRSFDNENMSQGDTILWLNANQNAVVSSAAGKLQQPINLSDRDYVKKALSASWQVHLGRPVQGRLSKRWALPLSLGVTNLDGEFAGILIFSINIDKLSDALDDMAQSNGVEFYIYTPAMSLILSNNASTMSLREDDTHLDQLSQVDYDVSSDGVLSRPELFTATSPFAYYKKSSLYRYIIYMRQDGSYNVDEVSSILIRRGGQVFVIAIFLLGLLYMVRSLVIRPIEELSVITADIAAGKGFTPLDDNVPVEISQLSGQIAKLSSYIDEQNLRHHDIRNKEQRLLRATDTAQHVYNIRSEFMQNIAHIYHQQLQYLERTVERDILSQIPPTSREQDSLLARYYSQLDYAKRIKDDIRIATQQNYGAMTLHDIDVSIAFSMHRAIRIFHERMPSAHSEIKPNIGDNLPTVFMDEAVFIDIMVHLFGAVMGLAAQGTAVTVHPMVERDDQGKRHLAVHLLYQAQLYTKPVIASANLEKTNDEISKQRIMTTDKVAIAIARMQAALYHGTITTSGNKGEAQRIILRLPLSHNGA